MKPPGSPSRMGTVWTPTLLMGDWGVLVVGSPCISVGVSRTTRLHGMTGPIGCLDSRGT